MNTAIAYIRISDKDQSNFSIEGQQSYIQKDCTQNNIHLLETFIDDGRSAKNFDRPDWKKLETFIQQHHQQVNYLIVVKYDRFSRNAAQGLQKIEWLEKKYNIIIISVFEKMFIDYDSPFFFKQRADMLVAAEFEWHVIRDRTRFGIHQATSSGRFVNMAPHGYINARDEKNKPILVINEEKAVHIRRIFQQYLSGHSFTAIANESRQSGFKIYGRSTVPYILTNPVYAGFIKVPAYRKEQAKVVKGLHEAIVPETTWYEVQKKLSYKDHPKRRLSEEVPLRARVAHICGRPFTAGKSRGKRNEYWYYKCNYCSQTSYSAITMHKKFSDLLTGLSFSRTHIDYMIAEGEAQMQQRLEESRRNIITLRHQLTTTQQNLESLEEKYITNQVQADTYNRFYNRYSSEIAGLQSQINHLSGDQKEKWQQFRTGLLRLENLHWLWDNASLLQKHEFIRLVFNSSLMYNGDHYTTPYLLPIFHHNLLTLKEKNLIHLIETGSFNVKSMGCAPPAPQVEHPADFISLINNIKTA